MSSPTSSEWRQAPAADVLEVSVFGPGVGECIVLHLGANDWMVVDSCVEKGAKSPTPIALDYLSALGVDPRAVKLFVVTHWHDDHMRGAATLLRECVNADFVCSQALRAAEFVQFINAGRENPPPHGPAELGDVFRQLAVRTKSGARHLLASDDKLLFRRTGVHAVEVHSLSPSTAACERAAREIAKHLPTKLAPIKKVAPTANEVAVALWVVAGRFKLLLGADLEESASPLMGWKAIVASPTRPDGLASFIKVPHHGSENADSPDVWNQLLEPSPLAAMTPFASGKKPLPSPDDVARLLGRTPKLFCTAEPKGRKPAARDSAVDRTMREMSTDRRVIEGAMGHVRIRVPFAVGEPEVEFFRGARALTTA